MHKFISLPLYLFSVMSYSYRYTYLFANQVRGTEHRRSRWSWNSSTDGAGIATGIRQVPLGCRTEWRPNVLRKADTAWPGRRKDRTRCCTLAAGPWATPEAKVTTKATRAMGLPSCPSSCRRRPSSPLRLPKHRRPQPLHRLQTVPAASTAPVVRTTMILWSVYNTHNINKRSIIIEYIVELY